VRGKGEGRWSFAQKQRNHTRGGVFLPPKKTVRGFKRVREKKKLWKRKMPGPNEGGKRVRALGGRES